MLTMQQKCFSSSFSVLVALAFAFSPGFMMLVSTVVVMEDVAVDYYSAAVVGFEVVVVVVTVAASVMATKPFCSKPASF